MGEIKLQTDESRQHMIKKKLRYLQVFQMLPKVSYIVHAPENQGHSAGIPLDATLSAKRHLNSLRTQAFSSAGCICVYPNNAYISYLLNPLVLIVYLPLMCSSSLTSHRGILLAEPHPIFLLLPIFMFQALLTNQ